MKIEILGVLINVIRAYAPQVGCELEDKEEFWGEVELVQSIAREERVVIREDLNENVGEGNSADEGVAGRCGVGERNAGTIDVDFAKQMEMAIVNTYFNKEEERRITYKREEEVYR